MSLNEQQQKDLKILENHLQNIQAFVDENLIKKNKAMTSSSIFSGLGNFSPDINESEFKRSFSLNVKVGNIKGIVGAKRAGFKPLDTDSVNDDDNDTLPAPPPIQTEEDEGKFSIKISKSLRLHGVDKRNWALQKRQQVNDGYVWLSTNYWPDLNSALKGVARLLLNKEIKSSSMNVSDLQEVANLVKEAEDRVCNKLSSMMKEPVVEEKFEEVA